MTFRIIFAILLLSCCKAIAFTFPSHTGSCSSLTFCTPKSEQRNTVLVLFSRKDSEGENNIWNGIKSLWDEVIEVSTYGPSERKMLKAQRERQKQLEKGAFLDRDADSSQESFELDLDDDRAWVEAYSAAAQSKNENKSDVEEEEESLDFDGYALRNLITEKWGAPLDLDFQRIGEKIYCTILPLIGYGSPLKSRHDSELDYLMHLQGVIEVLHKYENLENFIAFIETTDKVPKRGTDSVPFRLKLNDDVLEKIIRK